MTEPPKIDELLEWLDDLEASWNWSEHDVDPRRAIRAILEQHRQPPPSLAEARRAFLIEERHEVAIEAVRAFVARVDTQYLQADAETCERTTYGQFIKAELAAMEADNVL